jgi:hypothetical protein
LKEILEEKKNELSPHLKIPPKFLQSKGAQTTQLTRKMFQRDASKCKGSTGRINCTWKKLKAVKKLIETGRCKSFGFLNSGRHTSFQQETI